MCDDHDYSSSLKYIPVGGLIIEPLPSVLEESWYGRGKLYMTLCCGTTQATDPWRHAVQTIEMLTHHYCGIENIPIVLIIETDGGTGSRS